MLAHTTSTSAPRAFNGLVSRPGDALLVSRALDYLAAGPARAQDLVAAVCQLPHVPATVAEHMAAALLADVPTIGRDDAGLWTICQTGRPAACAAARLSELSYVVVDLETTGSRPQHGDRITEIAAVLVRRGEIADVFETLVNPQRPIPKWVTALTNISWGMVKDAPPFGAVCERVLSVLGGHVFVAHNARFDWGFLTAEIERATGRALDGPRLCTVRLARKVLPQLRSRSLDNVAMYYGVEITPRHRAAGDAIATANVLVRLLAAARDRGCETWEDLDVLLAPAPRRRRRRRPPAGPQPVGRDTTA
ncbi:MAG: PolC-type DNA polymerase III [Gemmatimonadaceae bacterium]